MGRRQGAIPLQNVGYVPHGLSFQRIFPSPKYRSKPLPPSSVLRALKLCQLVAVAHLLCCSATGIIPWGRQVQHILDDAKLFLQQTRSQDITSPITVLLEGWIATLFRV